MKNDFLISTIHVCNVYVFAVMRFVKDDEKIQKYTIWGERKAKAQWELQLECGIL